MCKELTTTGRCDNHKVEKKSNWNHTKTTTERGYGAKWRKIRLLVLKRDNYKCQCVECKGLHRLKHAKEVDHIVSKAKGGTDDMSNLQAINHDCHKRKTARE